MTLLTPIEDLYTTSALRVRCGTDVIVVHGQSVRDFVDTVDKAYLTFPEIDCLRKVSEFVPEEIRDVFEFLYETIKELDR